MVSVDAVYFRKRMAQLHNEIARADGYRDELERARVMDYWRAASQAFTDARGIARIKHQRQTK